METLAPFMIVAHVACLAALLASRTESRNEEKIDETYM